MSAFTTDRTRTKRGPKIHGAGEVIQELREQANWSQKKLADELGWDKGRLSKYENNKLSLSLGELERVAEVLGQPRAIVILRCFKHRFPEMIAERSEIGHLLESLAEAIDRHQTGKNRQK